MWRERQEQAGLIREVPGQSTDACSVLGPDPKGDLGVRGCQRANKNRDQLVTLARDILILTMTLACRKLRPDWVPSV